MVFENGLDFRAQPFVIATGRQKGCSMFGRKLQRLME